MLPKLVKYLIFSVVSGAFAIVLSGLVLWARDASVGLAVLIGKGQLLPSCAGLAGTAAGDAYSAARMPPVWRISIGGMAALIWVGVSVLYTELTAASASADRVAMLSWQLFSGAAFLGCLATCYDALEAEL